ncbi:hypothetical protein [Opitutus terrae]|uniref:ACT domain-containing protein n=1 Tax=Opitutus terrae (strain DSM 11246 / JCM 15787 / PB90-1) TaxID=452637 RepID=B1ZY95_OPITP|nr:hypothetical protein [Opitutus terrae]ACB76241.1 ACT domain-containing protein [Opitutus terrae PB90-1]
MPLDIKRVESFQFTVANQVRDGARLLSQFAAAGVDLHAFKAVPAAAGARFTLLAADSPTLAAAARAAGVTLDGPRPAVLIKGGEEPGALSGIYRKLAAAEIDVPEASGIAGVNGGYGVVLYLKPENCARAIAALSQ